MTKLFDLHHSLTQEQKMKEKVNYKDDSHILLFVVVWAVFFIPFILSKVDSQQVTLTQGLSEKDKQKLEESCNLLRSLCNTGNQKACADYDKISKVCDEL